jgi:hypothetical protein
MKNILELGISKGPSLLTSPLCGGGRGALMHGASHPLFLPDFPSLVSASLPVVISIVLRWRCQNRLKEFHMGFSVCHS